MDRMKLFVVGEISADPAEWSIGSRAIVVAPDADTAMSMVYGTVRVATEIPLDEKKVISITNEG